MILTVRGLICVRVGIVAHRSLFVTLYALPPERQKGGAFEVPAGERCRIGEPAVNRSVARSFRLWHPGRHGTRVEADILRLSCAVPRPSPSIDASGSEGRHRRP